MQQLAGVGELFDSVLVFENYPVDGAAAAGDGCGGLRLERVRGHDATHYPLSLMVQPGERLQLRLDYRSELFDRGSVAVLGERLLRLLSAAVADPGRAVGSLGLLSDAERAQLLEGFNDTARPVSGQSLPELFAAQAGRTPAAVALLCGERRLSYAALCSHAHRLAHHLRGLGVGPETVVGLCVERSPEMVIGLLGILAAGGAYLPLDPHYPAERLSFMLADAGAPVLVGEARLLARLPQAGATLVRLDADWPQIARKPEHAPDARARAAQPRLRHLHLRINRNPKRCGGQPRRAR